MEVVELKKPTKCPIAVLNFDENIGNDRIKSLKEGKCFLPAIASRMGSKHDKIHTPNGFICPGVYDNGGNYVHCEFFSVWWWHKFGGSVKKTIKSRKRTAITNTLRHEVFKRDNYKCVECGVSKDERCLHVDHIIPISRGGTDELDNLQTLCVVCNLAKNNRIFKKKTFTKPSHFGGVFSQ